MLCWRSVTAERKIQNSSNLRNVIKIDNPLSHFFVSIFFLWVYTKASKKKSADHHFDFVHNIYFQIIKVPMLQGFGLIYKDKYSDMGMSATEFSTIINLNSAFSMSIGLASGPLLKIFGYRKIAAASGFLFSSGLFLTSFATCFTHFIITYSIITCKLKVKPWKLQP